MKKKNKYLNISERKILLRFFDIVSVFIGIYLISSLLNVTYITFNSTLTRKWLLTFLVYFIFFGNIFEMYNLKVSSSRYRIFQSIILTCFSSVVFYVFTPIITPSLPSNRIEILYLFLGVTLPLMYWRFIYSTFIFSPKFSKKILIIGKSTLVEGLLFVVKKRSYQNNVVSYISEKELPNFPEFNFIDIKEADLLTELNKEPVDEIVVSTNELKLNPNDTINKQIVYLFESGVNIKSIENLYEEITECVAKENLNHEFYKYLSYSKNHENSIYLVTMRLIDVIISILGLISLLFFIPFVFIGNLFGSRGPLFYRQIRVGLNGKKFSIYKFRSMIVDAETGKAIWASKNDTRITSFGKFIRKTRIDEIPQFWNILIGEMRLIGPRPERPEFVESLKKEIPFYAIRHVVRPGLTGWAQVMFPYASTTREQEIKLRYDLYYIKSRSIMMDLKIILKTISTVIQLRGQ